MSDDDPNQRDHPIFDRFEAAGYPRKALTDPAHLTHDDLETGEWRAVVWQSHGVESYDVDADNMTDASLGVSELAVEIMPGRGVEQPIDFADEHGELNDDLRPMSVLESAADRLVVFFYGPGSARHIPEFDREEAIEALGYWGSEGWVPRITAESIAEPFDLDIGDGWFTDDPDVEGEELIRADRLAAKVAHAVFAEVEEPDSGISGHKKRRRQQMYRNLNKLRDEFGVGDD